VKKGYFIFGRYAIYNVLNILNIKDGDDILTPAWNCDESLDPFRKKNCNLIFYRTNPITLEVNLEHLISSITPNTKLIHIVNHFGNVQDWDNILFEVRKYNIPILEDNAYSFLSKYKEKLIGSFGDFSIFSYRKVLPVRSGAILIINSDFNICKIKSSLFYKEDLKQIPYFLLDLVSPKIGILARRIRLAINNNTIREYPFPLQSNSNINTLQSSIVKISKFDDANSSKSSSILSQFFVKYYTTKYIKTISLLKKRNYQYLVSNFQNFEGITIINPFLSSDIIPTVFSILLSSKRDYIFYKLREKGFPVKVWPTLSSEVLERLDEFPDVEKLGRCLLQIDLVSYSNSINYIEFVRNVKELIKNES
jgi:dTDP-4-amino-4,6-dideoxygalactose transaminase